MALEDELGRRQEGLIQAGLVLASELSLPAVLQKIVDLARTVADARYGALGVLSDDGSRIGEFVTSGVTDEERRRIGRLPEGRGILGVLIREARPLRLRRIQDDPRSVGFPPNHPRMTSFLGVPILVHGRVFGNLYLTEKRGADEFGDEDQRAVETLATQAGVAVENARLREELERLAVLEDRERIEKELHDGVVQSLFAVGMALQATDAVAGDPEAVRRRLDQAVHDIDGVIRDLRSYIFGLRPGGVVDRALERALGDLADDFRAGSAVHIEVSVDAGIAARLSARATDVVQAAREALSNAVRHSGGARVTLSLGSATEGAALGVEDDGKGFEPGGATGTGHGLGNLRARAEALGGTLHIDSAPGRGTRVRLVFPLPA